MAIVGPIYGMRSSDQRSRSFNDGACHDADAPPEKVLHRSSAPHCWANLLIARPHTSWELTMLTRMTGLTLSALIAALTLSGCSSGGSDTNAPPDPQPTGNTVSATPAETFTPGTLTVNTGETVTFAFGALA